MKVIHFISGIDLASGGPARSMPAMCLGLKDVGVQCEVRAHLSAQPNDAKLRAAGIPVHLVPQPSGVWGRVVATQLVEGCDLTQSIAHLQNIWDPALHWVARECRRRGVAYVVSPRGMLEPWSLAQKRWKKRLALALYQMGDLRRAACIHATAQSEMEHVRALGIRCPIAVIPNGIKVEDYTEKDYLAPRTGRRRLLFLSRLHEKKGID
ncbi:MAG: glycosyltransferase, partial [Bacteroidaceae bacterium]|nr:glycosyltransferase [Bacteroidaceae bacterium]